MSEVFPFNVDVWEEALGAYLVSKRFATIEEARASWLTLTLDGCNAQVSRQSGSDSR